MRLRAMSDGHVESHRQRGEADECAHEAVGVFVKRAGLSLHLGEAVEEHVVAEAQGPVGHGHARTIGGDQTAGGDEGERGGGEDEGEDGGPADLAAAAGGQEHAAESAQSRRRRR